jgi:hypothetical protein
LTALCRPSQIGATEIIENLRGNVQTTPLIKRLILQKYSCADTNSDLI